MKSLYTILFTLTCLSLHAQITWQEHLSHDRSAYAHLGHFIVNDDVALVMGNARFPMNTFETITGNTKKESELISDYFTYVPKTT